MRTQLGLLSLAGLFICVSADAQTPPAATAATAFDGTYRFVSSTRVNQTFTSRHGQFGQCEERTPGPLTIAQGRARYTTETGRDVRGRVGPYGEVDMRMQAPGQSRPVELRTVAQLDNTGTIRGRQIGGSCSYDFVWQK
jgi:hypothetical protein